MKTPLESARKIRLDHRAGQMPQMRGAIANYFQPMTFIVVQQAVSAGVVVESGDAGESWTSPEGKTITGKQVNFSGFMVAREKPLQLKTEGNRSWFGFDLWTTPQLQLKNRDAVAWIDLQYRVMAVWPMKNFGFMHYFVVEDYRFSGPLEQVTGQPDVDGDQTPVEDASGNPVIM